MSTSTTSNNCPKVIPVPFTVTVNTSASIPPSVVDHPEKNTHAGFTRISEFSLTPVITALSNIPNLQDNFHLGFSDRVAKWDFGDGYSLSGTDTFTAKHIYNVPGIYTVSVFLYDKNSNAHKSTFTETISVFNYADTQITIETRNITEQDGINARNITAGENKTFNLATTASWQDVPNPNIDQTFYFTSSGSVAKPYDVNNKYAHIVPFNAFYDENDNLINNITGLKSKLYTHFFYVSGFTVTEVAEKNAEEENAVILYASTDEYIDETITKQPHPIKFKYYDDIPTDAVNLLIRLDSSKHRVKNFYVDNIETDINNSQHTFLETDVARPFIKDKNTVNKLAGTSIGIPVKVVAKSPSRLSFTSTGMKEMSSIQYKRQGDKFQVFIALADDKLNIAKYFNTFYLTEGPENPAQDRMLAYQWTDGTTTLNSYVSSLCTEYFPYDTSATSLSNFVYLNIDPVSAGTWTLNITGRLDSFDLGSSKALSAFGKTIDYDPNGPLGAISLGIPRTGVSGFETLITGSYTFTVYPSTNDVELYKLNEDVDYSEILKSYRFQSLQNDYDKLFDGIFTSFVGEASSSPTTFGKTIFEKIANFTINHSDVDFCSMNSLKSFYDLFNEDIDITIPDPPPELKRLYDLFSVKISKLLGHHERFNESFDTQYYTSSASSRNIDLNNPIDPSSYLVTAGTNFVARQKFNNKFILIKPQQIPNLSAAGSINADNPVLSTYYLSTYNAPVLSGHSNWGWPLDTTISGASGLSGVYEFYPHTYYNTICAEFLENNLIDYKNNYNTISRTVSTLSASWDPENGIIYKNLDYQIRKGLQL